ncbi:methyltransferase type 11 [Apodospora peruviana]|uniref:Methyltransferase type 11 n=1 Tax=Apodospora peruviana TaxID=516989 RepID=A0AAE0IDG7_9PEZI|nr:methyltransferase type 11 [Apodospora peruviana]
MPSFSFSESPSPEPQYDQIGPKFNVLQTLPISVIQTHNLRRTLTPLLQDGGGRVLDLACGTGMHTTTILSCGASYVLGIDISAEMIRTAERTHHSLLSNTEEGLIRGPVKFMTGDATTLGLIADEPKGFDVVLGSWLLNYASTPKEMTSMFQTIAANLKPGGVFVGLTLRPVCRSNIEAYGEVINKYEAKRPGRWGLALDYHTPIVTSSEDDGEETTEGWQETLTMGVGDKMVKFENYHLCREVYEEAALAGDMRGKFEWRKVEVPREAIRIWGEEFWKTYKLEGPWIGLIVVGKDHDDDILD